VRAGNRALAEANSANADNAVKDVIAYQRAYHAAAA